MQRAPFVLLWLGGGSGISACSRRGDAGRRAGRHPPGGRDGADQRDAARSDARPVHPTAGPAPDENRGRRAQSALRDPARPPLSAPRAGRRRPRPGRRPGPDQGGGRLRSRARQTVLRLSPADRAGRAPAALPGQGLDDARRPASAGATSAGRRRHDRVDPAPGPFAADRRGRRRPAVERGRGHRGVGGRNRVRRRIARRERRRGGRRRRAPGSHRRRRPGPRLPVRPAGPARSARPAAGPRSPHRHPVFLRRRDPGGDRRRTRHVADERLPTAATNRPRPARRSRRPDRRGAPGCRPVPGGHRSHRPGGSAGRGERRPRPERCSRPARPPGGRRSPVGRPAGRGRSARPRIGGHPRHPGTGRRLPGRGTRRGDVPGDGSSGHLLPAVTPSGGHPPVPVLPG